MVFNKYCATQMHVQDQAFLHCKSFSCLFVPHFCVMLETGFHICTSKMQVPKKCSMCWRRLFYLSLGGAEKDREVLTLMLSSQS